MSSQAGTGSITSQPSTRSCPAPTRRQFLGSSALATVAALSPVGYLSEARGQSRPSPNEKLQLAIIGVGGRGQANIGGVKGESIVALCDVNPAALDQGQRQFPEAKTFSDWREVVGRKDIDGVVISTADHHHALAALAAMRSGKHVYCEKPLAHTVHEARQMQDEYLRRKDTLATQMGTQIHATDNYRRVVELVQAGAIGPVREAHVWCGRTIAPVDVARLDAVEKPKGFNWDVWLGPAADRPYNPGYWKGGNLNWNRRWEFGNGVLGDMGSHLIDLAFWALKLRRPTSVQSEGPKPDPVACPPWQVITWEHPPRTDNQYLKVPAKIVWYHGPEGMKRRSQALQEKLGGDTDLNKWFIGAAFVGAAGILVADYGKHLLSPTGQFRDYRPPEPSIKSSPGHYREWIQACKSGSPTLCNFDYSGALIEHNLLGNVAHRVGKKLQWDAKRMKATNTPEAAKYLTKDYRQGWSVGD